MIYKTRFLLACLVCLVMLFPTEGSRLPARGLLRPINMFHPRHPTENMPTVVNMPKEQHIPMFHHRRTMVSQWLHWMTIVVPTVVLLAILSKYMPQDIVVKCGVVLGAGLFALETASILSEGINLPQVAVGLNLPQVATNLGSQAATNLSLSAFILSAGYVLAALVSNNGDHRRRP